VYKILIADDEKNIRLGLQAMINREFPDTFDFVIAADGQEALDNMVDIDILLTDIKMPRMDGIQLIKELQQMEHKPALIILSGYDDFVYAKEAIKCKVINYLLKPVNRTELFNTLKSTMEDLESSNMLTYQHIDEYRANQFNYILLNSNLQKNVIEEIFKKMKLGEFSKGYYVGVVDTRRKIEGAAILNQMNQFLQVDKSHETPVCFLDKDERVVIITEDKSVFSYLAEQFGKDLYSIFSIGISEKAEDITELKKTYEQAEYALKYHFVFPRRKVIFYDFIKEKQCVSSLPVDLIEKISNMLGTDRDKEIKSNLLQVLDYETISHNEISYLENVSELINKIIFENFFSRLGEESIETFKLFNKIGNIYNFEDFHEYFHALEDLLMRIHEYTKQMKSVYSEQKYMDKVITYIKENYHKDLNLAVVSNYISLNYSYFSHMFKEYTGQNFVDYLKMVRIEKAKQLLKESEYKVFEISEMVGYKNPKQFARVFREIVGISPSEYKEQK
jgi:two-component system, response regulator YesN